MSQATEGYRFGMLIDVDKCTGCGACSVACMSENNIGVLPDETDKIRSITWLRLYQIDNGAPFPETEVAFFPRPCQHCAGGASGKWKDGFFEEDQDPQHHHTPCVSVCPATATDYDDFTGIVSQIPTRCIGCRYCVAACPYHARYFNWYDVPWPKGSERALSPFVAPRMRGVVEKCTFCFHRYQAARNKCLLDGSELEEAAYQTACTQACPSQAIIFGDLHNEEHEVSKKIKEYREQGRYVFRLLERLATDTKVYYATDRMWVRRLGDNYLPGEVVTPAKKAGA
ncbi:MAG: 4Fe-4S dicluster domain-containing protein [Deltaproteobacteria bacterium]|nr:4Fe-4S dicluster domain-containing protein [Deltaproteobacteria bacterium]